MPKIELPKGLIELHKLEKQYPDWSNTPDTVKDEMLELVFANGGFEWFHEEKYLKYLLDLAERLSKGEDKDKITKRLKKYAKFIHDGYSPGLLSKKSTERKLAEIYVMVEEYRAIHTEATITKATKVVSEKLGEKVSYVHRKYYVMKSKLIGISLDEVKSKFDL